MKTRNIIILIPLLLMILLVSSCYKGWNRIEGNYDVAVETRYLNPFNRVYNEGSFDVYIIPDTVYYVVIEAESNLISRIATIVKGSNLEVTTNDNLQNHYPMKVYIHTPDIHGVFLSGSGLIDATDISTPFLEIALSGSGYVNFVGEAETLYVSISGSGDGVIDAVSEEIEAKISGSGELQMFGSANKGTYFISGSGEIRAYDLVLQECYADISGSGDMFISVEDYLDVTISGSGSVYYLGDPVIDTHISGSGNVIHP